LSFLRSLAFTLHRPSLSFIFCHFLRAILSILLHLYILMISSSTSRISFTLLLVSLFLGFTHLIPSIHAQTFKPAFLPYPISGYFDRQGLYVAGGHDERSDVGKPMSQAFTIDLSMSWNTNNPQFKKLPDFRPVYYGPSTVSADGKQWVVFYNATVFAYNFGTSKWSTLFNTPDYIAGDEIAVTDPETGSVYIMIDDTEGTFSEAYSYAAAWSASQKKLYLISGKTYGSGSFETDLTHLNMFSYSDKDGWFLSLDTVLALYQLSGTKIVLFGGFIKDKLRTLPDIHFLDVATMIWTRGPDADQKERRARAACAVSNDQFIAWGGQNFMDDTPVNSTIVYNLKTNKWTSDYNGTPEPSTSSAPIPSSSASPNGSPLDNGSQHSTGGLSFDAMIAIIALGIAGITLAFGTFILCRMRRKHSQKVQHHIPDTQEPPKPVIADGGLHIKTSMTVDPSGRGPQESSMNSNSKFEKHLHKNPQPPVTQFPLHTAHPANPHATIPPQPSHNPQRYAAEHVKILHSLRGIHSAICPSSRDKTFTLEDHMPPSSLSLHRIHTSLPQAQDARPQTSYLINTIDTTVLSLNPTVNATGLNETDTTVFSTAT
ncbi:MAG: hypothetical protein J3Q66DRAFT_408874, partial [Benniella sp.]